MDPDEVERKDDKFVKDIDNKYRSWVTDWDKS
jgi:hypothetical protein